jgi:hypothetical protein
MADLTTKPCDGSARESVEGIAKGYALDTGDSFSFEFWHRADGPLR